MFNEISFPNHEYESIQKYLKKDVIIQIRKIFAESHVYFTSHPDEDLERIRKNYVNWRHQ